MRAGNNSKDAAKHIAKKHPIFNLLKRNAKDSLDSSILSWRKHIEKEKDAPDADAMLSHQSNFFKKLEKLNPDEMRGLGKELLKQAAQRVVLVFRPKLGS